MKKDCEPLRGKKQELLDKLLVQVNEMTSSQKGTGFHKGYNLGFETAIDCAFDRIASAVRFYNRYEYHEAMLRDEDKKAWDNWLKSDEFKIYKKELENKNYLIAENWYKDWLVKYCFKDVIDTIP